MPNNYTKKCLTLLVIMEMQIKTKMRHSYTFNDQEKKKRNKLCNNIGEFQNHHAE